MNLAGHFQTMLEYEKLANQATLTALEDAKGDIADAVKIFAHMQAVRDLWLRRLRGEKTAGFDPFPTWSLGACADTMKRMDDAWAEFLKTLDDRRIDQPIRYEDTSGGFWATRPYDALVQAFNHSSHHRGQIATLLRRSGNEPMRVDFIAYHRTKET